MKLLMLGIMPYEIYRGEYLFAFAVFLAAGISLIPSVVERNYRITLPFELDLLITLSLFLHTFMGEGLSLYKRLWLFDKMLHLYGSAVIALLAFLFVYTLHYTKKVRLTVPLIGFFTVIFALAAGGLWEMGEFGVDNIFGKQTQDGLDDTMYDMINDFIGGVIVAMLGMAYVRYSKPETRKRLTRPLGDVFGLADRIDRIKRRFKKRKRPHINRPLK
ncbi:MAG: hypothetical protein HZB21_03805 [Deltaproteobacteria bacterium]|nr:hypothetical protein [Deltaproteobacteria bacterium]